MARTKRLDLSESETAELLAEIREWRRRCNTLAAHIPINGPLYNGLWEVTRAIDSVAEALTGNRETFWTKKHSIP